MDAADNVAAVDCCSEVAAAATEKYSTLDKQPAQKLKVTDLLKRAKDDKIDRLIN